MMPLWMTAMRPDWSVCGMRVGRGRRAVGGPAGVSDARACPVGILSSSACSSTLELARGLHDLEAIAVHHRDARRVVAAVLEPAQPFEQQPGRLPGSDVPHDAAHQAMNLTARVRERRPTALPHRLVVGASAMSRTIGSVPEGRTWSQRSRQESRSPSRSSASASGKRARSLSYSGRSSETARSLRLHDGVSGGRRHQLRHRYPRRGKEMQDQGHPQGRIASDVQRGQHDAAVAFAADHRALISNGTGHVGFAHRRADQARARGAGRVLHDQAGRQVHDDRGGLSPQLLRRSNTARTANASV